MSSPIIDQVRLAFENLVGRDIFNTQWTLQEMAIRQQTDNISCGLYVIYMVWQLAARPSFDMPQHINDFRSVVQYKLDGRILRRGPRLIRGLTNKSAYLCYVNALLVLLFSIPPFQYILTTGPSVSSPLPLLVYSDLRTCGFTKATTSIPCSQPAFDL